MSEPIDIILPVYRDLDATQRAIRAVLESDNRAPWHLIVINDASPETEMMDLLASLCEADDRVTLLENEENLGFVATVNRGMALHEDRDVLLLNSDTMVHGDWLDRMVAHVDDKTASLTPFSNNATICSTPRMPEDNAEADDPAAYTAQMDRTHADINAGASVEIPVGVGFCMWLSRAALKKVGLFDAEAFGRGYGEECDWCMRAAEAGFAHRLACDVFVYHEGGSSFGDDANALKDNASALMRRRWPAYEPAVSAWVKADPAKPYRLAAVAESWRCGDLPVMLHINHQLGGGTEKHVRDLCRQFGEHMRHLILTPEPGGGARLRSAREEDGVNVLLYWPAAHHALTEALSAFGVSRVHLHHLLGFDEPTLRRMVQSLGVPLDVTIHDYHLLSPDLYRCLPDGQFAGEPGDSPEETGWRAQYGWWLGQAARVIAPSQDVAARFMNYYPNARMVVMPHEDDPVIAETAPPPLADDEPLRIAIVGALSWHKGAARVRALAAEAAGAGLALEIQHFGQPLEATPPQRKGSVHFASHGRYEPEALPEMLAAFKPHLIWFPGTCLETYSYTLSEALAYGAPLWVPQLGPFPERTEACPWAFYYAADATPPELVEQLALIRDQICSGETPEPISLVKEVRRFPVARYETDYAHPPQREAYKRPQGERRRVVGWLTHAPDHPDACAHLRLLRPLAHAAMANEVLLVPLSLEQAWDADIDVLYAARTTLTTSRVIDALREALHARNVPLVYDLDDDLLNLSEEHPEYEHYRRMKPGVEAWLRGADQITVSTAALQAEVSQYRSKQQSPPRIVPNYLDESLWSVPEDESIHALQAEQPAKVVYIGTPTHQPDFAAIAEAIRPVLHKHGATLSLIGVYSAANAPKWVEVIEPPAEALGSYPAFARWVQEQQVEQGWQVGLAPLRDLRFNHAKSGVKYMEYSALGLAGLYADLPPYRDVVTSEQTGLLVAPDDAAAWAEGLDRMLADAALRRDLAANAAKDVRTRHQLGADADFWVPVMQAALNAPAQADNISESAPLSDVFMELFRPAPTMPLHLRALRRLYHGYASHPLVRRVWQQIPTGLQNGLKHRVRRRLSAAS